MSSSEQIQDAGNGANQRPPELHVSNGSPVTVGYDLADWIENKILNWKASDVSESVPCSTLIDALEDYFMRMTNCRRGFTLTNKAFLRSKLLKHFEAGSDKDPLINLRRLSENDVGFNFTFFKWFTGIIEVVNAHLKPYWENGYIIGFIDRLSTEGLLSKVPHDGAFIVRFSESVLSSITLSYVLKTGNESITASVEPFTCDHLKSMNLPEILNGRLYHRQSRKGFTMVFFHEVSNGCESLVCEHKSVAFPPLLNQEKLEKPAAPNHISYEQYDQVLVVANPKDAEAAKNVRRDFDHCLGTAEQSTASFETSYCEDGLDSEDALHCVY